jgi:singapore isolate B (sub-type 7) whole genome shotgun sequence assembly, scaffold_0
MVEMSVVEKKDPNEGKIPYYLGAHVSAAGGAFHAVENASLLKANAFALFLKYD